MNAKDIPKPDAPTPGQVAPAPAKKNYGIVATLCALAVSSGSFMIGAVCGVVVAVGIFYLHTHFKSVISLKLIRH